MKGWNIVLNDVSRIRVQCPRGGGGLCFSVNTCSCVRGETRACDETDSCSEDHRWPVSTGRHSSGQMWDFIPGIDVS